MCVYFPFGFQLCCVIFVVLQFICVLFHDLAKDVCTNHSLICFVTILLNQLKSACCEKKNALRK